MSLPVVLLLTSALVAALTQIAKFFGQGAFKQEWDAVVPQIVAAVIASLLALLTAAHLPTGVEVLLANVVNQLGPGITAVLVAAGSYVAHDVAAIAQSLLVLLAAQLPAHK